MVGVFRLYALRYCGQFDGERKCDRDLDEGSEWDVRREFKACEGDLTTKKKDKCGVSKECEISIHATLDFRFNVNLDVDGFPARTSMSSSSESSCG